MFSLHNTIITLTTLYYNNIFRKTSYLIKGQKIKDHLQKIIAFIISHSGLLNISNIFTLLSIVVETGCASDHFPLLFLMAGLHAPRPLQTCVAVRLTNVKLVEVKCAISVPGPQELLSWSISFSLSPIVIWILMAKVTMEATQCHLQSIVSLVPWITMWSRVFTSSPSSFLPLPIRLNMSEK